MQASREPDKLAALVSKVKARGLRAAVDGWPLTVEPEIAAAWGVQKTNVDIRAGIRRSLTASFVDAAHAAGLQVGVRGIETEPNVTICQRFGVDTLQGYYLGRPQHKNELLGTMQMVA